MSEDGKITDGANLALVDDWSRFCYAALSEWPLAVAHGKWTTWDGKPYYRSNYLLLELVMPNAEGVSSEPLCIYSADEELTIASRIWHEHHPDFDQSDQETIQAVKLRAEQWFDGKFRVAVFFHGAEWRGTGTIEAADVVSTRLEELRSSLVGHFQLDRVELRGPWSSKDIVFEVTPQQVLI